MVPEERKTVGMLTGSKQELFERDHPVIRQLREIPELIFPDEMEKLPPFALSLKQLFTRKQMDENHVDCLILYRIAAGALHILEELSRRGICPGLIEIGDFYAELLPGSVQVYLTHPEKFQLLHYEQDYEWYPEDERLFGELELFDKDAQRRADVRLLYKILVASAKGNVKMPPKYTEADYSELFYKALPDEWKELFQERPDCDYATMKEMLRQCIAMEESFARAARERLDEKAQKKLEEEERLSAENGGQEERQGKKTLFSMIVLLRTELEDSRIMSRMLYQLQDELETETSLSQWEWRQAFVFGNGNIAVKEFATYEPGFRCHAAGARRGGEDEEGTVLVRKLTYRSSLSDPGKGGTGPSGPDSDQGKVRGAGQRFDRADGGSGTERSQRCQDHPRPAGKSPAGGRFHQDPCDPGEGPSDDGKGSFQEHQSG